MIAIKQVVCAGAIVICAFSCDREKNVVASGSAKPPRYDLTTTNVRGTSEVIQPVEKVSETTSAAALEIELNGLKDWTGRELSFERGRRINAAINDKRVSLEDAALLLEKFPSTDIFAFVAPEIARKLAAADPESGLVWMSRWQGTPGLAAAYGGFGMGLQSTDPAHVLALSERIEDYKLRGVFLEGAMMYADNWAEIYKQLTLRPEAAGEAATLIGLLNSVADRIPLSEVSNYSSSIPETSRAAFVEKVVAHESRSHPEATAKWVLDVSKGLASAALISMPVGAWLRENSMEATAWVDQLPKGRVRDSAALEVVRFIAPSSVQDARIWSNAISDPKLRVRADYWISEAEK